MRHKLHLFTVLLSILCWTTPLTAQTSIVSEGFEQGTPPSWTQEPSSNVTPWIASNSGLTGISALEGNNYLSLYNQTVPTQNNVKMILPLVDISSLTTPELSFYLVQKARSASASFARDTLRIYARSSNSGTWTLLQTYSNELSSWTRQSLTLEGYSNNIQIAFEYVYGAGLGIGIDEIRLGELALCFTPNNLQTFRVIDNSAKLMWTAYEMALSYNIKVSTMPIDPSTTAADVFNQTVYFKPYTLTGLNPSTNYYFYVSANCGNGDESSWSSSGTFTTLCSPIALPNIETFDGVNTMWNCWQKEFQINGNWSGVTPSVQTYAPTTTTAFHQQGGQSVKLYGYRTISNGDLRTTSSWIASPLLQTTNISTLQISFWTYSPVLTAPLHIGVMSDATDLSTFEEVAEIQPYAIGSWEHYILPLTSITDTTAKHIAFLVDGGDFFESYTYYIDNITIDNAPACPQASLLRVTNAGENSADISWLGNANSWNVKVSTTEIDPTTDTADAFNGTATSSPYTITGLNSMTHYYVYLQANCDNGTTGAWSEGVEFRTTQTPATIPFTCDFEDPTQNNSWEFANAGQTNYWMIGNGNKRLGDNALYITNNGSSNMFTNSVNATVYAYRAVNLAATNYSLTFDYICWGTLNVDYMRVFLVPAGTIFTAGSTAGVTSATQPNNWIALTENSNLAGDNVWHTFEHNFSLSTAGTYYLVYYWTNDNQWGSQPPACIDNIQLFSTSCPTPSINNITARNIAAKSATIAWTSLGASGHDVIVSQGSTEIINTTVTGSDSLNVLGLQPNTKYTIQLRANCGNGSYGPWKTTEFLTACGSIEQLPYVETFSNYTTNQMPTCWTSLGGTSRGYITSIDATGDGIGCLYFYGTMVSPLVDVPGTTISDHLLTFKAYSYTANAKLIAGIVTDLTDPNSFIGIDTINIEAASTWESQTITFHAYNGAAPVALAFRAPSSYIYIDDLYMTPCPSCLKPKRAEITKLRATWAQLEWKSDPTVTEWDVIFGPRGFNPDATGMQMNHVTTPHCHITGLTAKTDYDAYVRGACGAANGNSEWLKVEFTTIANPASTPYTCGFEATDSDNANWNLEGNGSINQWIIGNGTYHTGNGSLYITDDGHSYHYNITQQTMAYATRTIAFTPGYYEISFDWTGTSEGTYNDYGRAFLVPLDTKTGGVSGSAIGNSIPVDPTWISLDNNTPLTNESSWLHRTVRLNITKADTMKLFFFWKSNTYGGTTIPLALDNVSVVQLHGCFDPDDITADFDSPYSGSFGWIGSDSASYHLIISDHLLTNPSGSTGVVDTVVTTPNVYVENLNPITNYYVYVQTTCSNGNVSPWKDATIMTPCGPVATIYEGFEGYDYSHFPACWTRGITSGSSTPSVNTNARYSTFGSCAVSMSANSYICTPEIAVPLNETEVEFWFYSTTNATNQTYLLIGAMSDPNNPNTFVLIDSIDADSHNPSRYHKYNFENVTGLTSAHRYIAFVNTSTAYGSVYLDEIKVGEYRMCNQPTNLAVTNLATDGATINWASGNGLRHKVVVSTAPIDPETAESTDADVLFVYENITTNSIDLAGELTPQSTYYIYVQSDCQTSDNKLSFWSEPFRFNTLCDTRAIPFEEHFLSSNYGEDVDPMCWTSTTTSIGQLPISGYVYTPYIYNGVSADNDNLSVRLYGYYSATASSKTCIASPTLNATLSALRMNLSVRGQNGSGKLLVGTMSDPGDLSSFQTLDTIHYNEQWKRFAISLANAEAGSQYVGFILDGAENLSSSEVFIDNIVIDSISPCNIPVALLLNAPDGNNLYISAEGMTAADSIFQIQLSTINSITDLDNVDNIALVLDTVITASQMPLHLTTIQPLTTYYAYARTVCGGGNYSERTYETIFTPCGLSALPFFEDFEQMTTGYGNRPTCWHSSSQNYPYIYNNMGGNNTHLLSVSGYDQAVFIMPPMGLTSVQGAEVSFNLYYYSAGSSIIVGSCLGDDPTTFIPQDTVLTPGSVWGNASVSFANYTGNNDRIAFKSVDYLYIDDVAVNMASNCSHPTDANITNITANSATLSWTAGSTETAWDVMILPQGADPSNGTPISVNSVSYTASDLNSGTNYVAYVRASCGSTTSSWITAQFRTTTIAEPLPLVTDFESIEDNARWETFGNATQWTFGNATYNGGTNSMYVSMNNGLTNAYNGPTTSAWATRCVSVDSAALYNISFDWKSLGQQNSDYFRVFLLPGNTDVTQLSTAIPTGNYSNVIGSIAVENGNLSSAVWNNYSTNLHLTPGNYKLAFLWVNDNDNVINPPAAIDNLRFERNNCYIANFEAHPTTNGVITLADTDCPTVEIAIAGNGVDIDSVVTLPHTFGGLTAENTYSISIRGFCLNGDTTNWQQSSFTTLCNAVSVNENTPYTENFDGVATGTLPSCWNGANINASGFPTVSTTYSVSTAGSLQLVGSNQMTSWATTPAINCNDMNQLRIRFSSKASATNQTMQVGIMTDPFDISTFVSVGTITPTTLGWELQNFSMANYTGNGTFVALVMPQNANSNAQSFYIDNVVVEIPQGCNAPTALTISNLTASHSELTFTPANVNDTAWEVKVSTVVLNLPDLQTGDVLDAVVHTPSVAVTGTYPLSTYYVYVRTLCTEDNSEWAELTFNTPCGVYGLPFTENFEGTTFLPDCWSEQNGMINNVLNGITSVQPSSFLHWAKETQSNGIVGTHTCIHISSSNMNYWLKSPEINITTASVLSFDLALTDDYSGSPISDVLGQQDKRFIVLVSRDGGNTWQQSDVLAEWNNTGSGRVLNDIASNGERVSFSLTPYIGDTITVAFYVESTVFNNSVDLHIGNITMNAVGHTVNYTDNVCNGTNYVAHGFNIPASSIHAENSPVEFSRYSGDTIYTLTLNVNPTDYITIEDTICNGDTYTQYGFNENQSGVYTAYFTNALGCDSIVTLNLVVNQGGGSTESVAICDDELPYVWNGFAYYTSGSYTHRIPSTSGCDSVATLNLTVNASYANTENIEVMDTDLPYLWNGQEITAAGTYTFNGTTAEGCDSVITLVLDVKVGLDYAEDALFTITPNPVERGGKVRIDANVEETAVVEIYTSNGKLVSRSEHQAKPIYVTMPEVGGLYMVRLTTATGRVMYGKVIVK